jgi:hypothetical protein
MFSNSQGTMIDDPAQTDKQSAMAWWLDPMPSHRL